MYVAKAGFFLRVTWASALMHKLTAESSLRGCTGTHILGKAGDVHGTTLGVLFEQGL